jgi:lipopolysaccharide biosynthesis glycosyltransferase
MSGQTYEQPLRVFIGYDHRQAVSYNVLQFSIFRHCSKPVAITPLFLQTLPLTRTGLTPFTYSRFLVPWLCGYQGWAMFLDIDYLCVADLAELFRLTDDRYAMMVSKNDKKFEWASMMMFNCGHPANQILTPDYVQDPQRCKAPHAIDWLSEDLVGDLPREWNHLVGYDAPRADAKLVHYTQGMPIFEETSGSEYAEAWKAEHAKANQTQGWQELMARSVHAGRTADGRIVAKLHPSSIVK